MENESLFQKLTEKLNLQKLQCRSTIKRIVPKLCAGALCLSLLFTTGCNNNSNNNNENNINNSEQNNNPYSEHSQVLQKVLSDNYYNWIIQEAESDINNYNNHSYKNDNLYKAIPYGFLEDEGFDIEAIKNNKLKCETELFILSNEKNSLYITCRVENKASENYYTHFMLKYQLTDKELNDLNLVYKNIAQGYRASFQAPIFIQELSIQKGAIKLSEMNITKSSEEELEKYLKTDAFSDIDLSMFANAITATYVQEIPENSRLSYHKYVFFNTHSSGTTTPTKKISQICITSLMPQTKNIDGAIVYSGPVGTYVSSQYSSIVADSLTTAKFYTIDDMSLFNMLNDQYAPQFGIEQ